MDKQTKIWLSMRLLPELAELIDALVILHLRMELSKSCAKIVDDNIGVYYPRKGKTHIVFDNTVLEYRRCPKCNDAESWRYVNNKLVSRKSRICFPIEDVSALQRWNAHPIVLYKDWVTIRFIDHLQQHDGSLPTIEYAKAKSRWARFHEM